MKITVMGLGVLGRGVGDVKYLAESGAEIIVTDLKKAEDLQTSLDQLKGFTNITYVLGEHRLEDFKDRDLVLKAAGVPLDNIYIAEAKKNGIPVEMSSALFARLSQKRDVRIIGVTGTRGKSTVTHMIYQILKAAQKKKEIEARHVFLGGNVKGVATLPFLDEVEGEDIAVLELDSWQLQGFGADQISPHIAVFTTFLADHMNYYKGDMAKYLDDKANIFKYQTRNDFVIMGAQAAPFITKKYSFNAPHEIRDVSDFPSGWSLSIPGEHNKYNAALAIAACRAMKISDITIREVLQSFTGVEGRLQLIKQVNGVKIYNDTTATMPDATIVGLKAVSRNNNVVLIMGGADKEIEMGALIQAIPSYCKAVVMLPGSGTDKIREQILTLTLPVFFEESLKNAVQTAFKNTQSGDVILLSPAFASFGLFKNEYDRGEQFNQIVASF